MTDNMISIMLLFSVITASCSQNRTKLNNTNLDNLEQGPAPIETSNIESQEVLSLIKTHCYACHNPAAKSHDEILAPPLAAVKSRYQMQYTDRDKFIEGMTNFILEPKKETALMRGAILNFNIMPPPTLQKDQIEQIASFLFDNKLEEPDWFAEHFKK